MLQSRGQELTGRRARFEGAALPYLDALYSTALRLCHNERDAEDLVQDALLLAYQGFDQFGKGGQDKPKPWLFKILTNTFVNKYRRRVLERQVQDAMQRGARPDLLSQAMSDAAHDPEHLVMRGRVSQQVHRALSALPEEFRVAVMLCDLEEFSYREIADIMDCPVGTVMSRLHRGRRLMQEALREFAAGEGLADVIPLPQRKGGVS